jgi:hypothetical protein
LFQWSRKHCLLLARTRSRGMRLSWPSTIVR